MKNSTFTDIFVTRRHWFLLISLILVAITCIKITSIKFNPDLKAYIDPNNPYLQELNIFEGKYTSTDSVIILVSSSQYTMTSPQGINLVDKVTSLINQLPFVYRVESVTNFNFIESNDDELKVMDLKTLEKSGMVTPEKYKAYILSEPLLVNRLITDDTKVAIINATFNLPEKRNAALPEILSSLEVLRSTIKSDDSSADIHLGGGVVVEAEMAKIVARDNMVIMPLIFLVGFIVNVYLLRSFVCYFSGLSVIILAVLSALGFTTMVGHEITNVSSMGFLLTVILATADTVHLTSNYVINLRKGMNKYEALKNSISSNFYAVVLTNITSVIGFLCLNTSGAPQFAAMGNIGAAGILLALFFTFTVYPSVLLFFNVRPPKQPLGLSKFSELLSGFAIRYNKPLLMSSVLVVSLAGSFIFNLKPNEDIFEYFKKGTETARTIDFMKANVKPQKYIYVDIRVPNGESITHPEFLTGIERFVHWAKEQEETVHVFSYLDVLKKLNKVMNGNDENFYKLPASQELASQYFLTYEMSMAYGQDISDLTDIKKSSARLVIATTRLNNEKILNYTNKLKTYLLSEPMIADHAITGMDVVVADHGLKSVNGMINGDGLTMLLVTGVIILLLRSFRYGLLSLLPNLAAPLFLYGLWGMVSENLTIAAIATFSVCFGIIVDDTLHILVKYLKSREYGHSVEESLRYSLANSGPAVVVTTLVFSFGAALLTFSDFVPNAEVGYIMAPLILFALVIELLIFPGLILWYEALFKRRAENDIYSPDPSK